MIKSYTKNVQALSKEERKQIHEYLRKNYDKALVANTIKGEMKFEQLNKNSLLDSRNFYG